ncbi:MULTISPECIES: gluconokinase [unclassified Leptolyngbya]|uniref:gluconokinase n=1 Tax=unclassified Leptolyngbya TaxID=2650499 RepID=UPI0016866657|nr:MULTISPECIES: gluconokinase [unclassified Leptolyngbya]MBD1910911.1 gluconokinase [Leptolyngbya sp. FACHB-8]MBD2154956.1 gluconokinase [Leptolyngbya sp. FACHB-16]
MNIQPLILGIDIGTTSTKALLFTARGTIVAHHAIGYPLLSPEPGIQEQEPEAILAAVVGCVQAVAQANPIPPDLWVGMCFSAAMHSLIAVDAQGLPLTRSITWADRRSAGWVDKVRLEHNGKEIYHRTGTPIHPMSPLLKLLWLQQEQPEIFQRATKFISIKEYVLYHWFGEYVVDHSIANATGLFNMKALDWDEEALSLANIKPDRLSQLVPTTHVLKGMKTDYAAAMGIPAEMPVVVGASDGVLANLGVGAIAPGIVAITIGTSGALRGVVDRPVTDPLERLFCYALTEKHWVIGGAVNNGGIILRWVRDNFSAAEVALAIQNQQDPYELITALAAQVPPGSNGLIFHPYLAGERSPLWDADARGSFFGLNMHHSRAHMIRAVMEGILYNLYVVMQSLQDAVGLTQSLRASGGFVRSPFWRQMLADIFNHEVVIPDSYESSGMGAAFLGLYALGYLPSLEETMSYFEAVGHHQPNPEHVAQYRRVLPHFVRLLELFRREYGAIAQLQLDLS